MRWRLAITSPCLLFLLSLPLPAQTAPLLAQNAHVGGKEPVPAQDAPGSTELDHMSGLISRLKAEVLNIQDPAARRAAQDNVDLWEHLLDKMIRDNPKANNSGPEHHHDNEPASPELKQSPKPQ